jgi:hypothetical protein
MSDYIAMWWEEVSKQVEEVTRKVTEYQRLGMPYPDWLKKQIRAADIIEQNPYLGGRMLIDGRKDEQTFLEKLEAEEELKRFDNG